MEGMGREKENERAREKETDRQCVVWGWCCSLVECSLVIQYNLGSVPSRA